jgi:hypothetical protein
MALAAEPVSNSKDIDITTINFDTIWSAIEVILYLSLLLYIAYTCGRNAEMGRNSCLFLEELVEMSAELQVARIRRLCRYRGIEFEDNLDLEVEDNYIWLDELEELKEQQLC